MLNNSLSFAAIFSFVWSSWRCVRCVVGKRSEQHNSSLYAIFMFFFALTRTQLQNGSEGIVCLWFSFERVWSFLYEHFYWNKKTLLNHTKKNCFLRGNSKKPTRTFCSIRCVLRQTTCLFFFFHDFSFSPLLPLFFNIWLS